MRHYKCLLTGLFISFSVYIYSRIWLSRAKTFYRSIDESRYIVEEVERLYTSPPTVKIQKWKNVSHKAYGNDIHNEWRKEILADIGDTVIDETDPEQIKLRIIRRIVERNNALLQMKPNKDCYAKTFTYLICIQVHSRKEFLNILLKSLKEVSDIQNALIVVSIDIFDEEINSLINSIDFTCFLQIYHPYSMAFFKNQYPAADPNDCSRDQKQNLDKCYSNAKYDTYGHYREVKFSQIKLHWTWKMNFILSQIEPRVKYEYIILLEEDHYLTPDALFVATQHIIPELKECEKTNICLASLGNYPKKIDLLPTKDSLIKTLWNSGRHNMGMVVSKKWTNVLQKYAFQFCNHDDYNWDFSLMRISQNQDWQVIYPLLPRVYHLGGECGYHTKKQTCNHDSVLASLHTATEKRKYLFFPNKKLPVAQIKAKFPAKFKGYGGWGDLRDRRLCLLKFNLLDDLISALM